MVSDEVKGLVIPGDAYDSNDIYVVNSFDKNNIYKAEIKKLVDISNLLNLDLENANINQIILRNDDIPTLVDSKIFRATFDSKLKDNDQLVVPRDEDYTMDNGYVSKEELDCFLTALSMNRKKLFNTTDEETPINVNVTINQDLFSLNEVDSFMASNILHATIINKIVSNSSTYGVNVPSKLLSESNKNNLESDFINSDWKNKSEMSNILSALKYMLGNNALISDVSESAILDKVFDDSFDVDRLYVSIVLNNTISTKLDNKLQTLNHEAVMNNAKQNISDKYSPLVTNSFNFNFCFFVSLQHNPNISSINKLFRLYLFSLSTSLFDKTFSLT